MEPLLPPCEDGERYFAEIYNRPPAHWLRALDTIAARHGLPAGPWERAALGRNIVFLGPEVVVKLGPPFWSGDMAHEAAALAAVAGRLPVVTPTPVAAGELDGWDYLIQARLPGLNLHSLWGELGADERAALAAQHGAIMAALHSLPTAGMPAELAFNWPRMLGGQREGALAAMERSGLSGPLLAGAGPYLDGAEAELLAEGPAVLVHGDLCHLNMLVEPAGGGWRISSLIDWGDARLGPRSHELISPGMHMYRGERAALAAWLRAYGLPGGELPPAAARMATARAMLAYADELGQMLGFVPGAATCASWPEVARRLWG